MRSVLLVTCAALPDGEELPPVTPLLDACAAAGLDARWVAWDDPSVDWTAADVVAVRSTWDYDSRREEFLGWAASVPNLLNGAQVFAWNTDKSYLADLASAGVPVVPTILVDGEEELAPAVAEFGRAVVKPRVGAGGRGIVVFDLQPGGPADLDESALCPAPWVVQPLVESVCSEGEYSVYVLGGEVVSQAQKHPAAGEIRVQEAYGGTTVAVAVTAEAADLARGCVTAAERLLGATLRYARVDQIRLADGTLAVSELEVTEPRLYLEVLPENGAAFVAACLVD